MCAARMHADEVHTDVPLVRRLIADQFPRWSGLPVEPVASSGTDNAMYRLGADMVVRLPRIEAAVANVGGEQRWLAWLAPHLPTAVPTPLGLGRPGSGYPWAWSVMRWLPGENPTVDALPEPDRLAVDLAGFIAALRRIDPAGGPAAGRGVPLLTRDAPTCAAIAELHDTIDTDAATTIWRVARDLPAYGGPAAWAHGDLSPGNVLLDGGRLSAIIDFAGVGVGDPTVDLIVAWNLLPSAARGSFRAALDVDDTTWLRGRGWALSIALIQLPYYRDTNPALASNSRHVIEQVIADHARPAGTDAGS